jgi:hypothetical protein
VGIARNDLFDFIVAETKTLAAEYERIQSRVKEDSGTAGDQGEDNWAHILKQWLPKEYTVVTKGRILSYKGDASPQVDVIVLHPGYPPALWDKKLYLAGGVAAAFECKLTLDAGDITKTLENCAAIKRLTVRRTGSPHLEMNSPLIYGLLSHSHSWKEPGSRPIENITRQLQEKDRGITKHPREMVDLVCVADLATWLAGKHAHWPAGFLDAYSGKSTTYFSPYTQQRSEFQLLSPMGLLLLTLLKKLAWEDHRLRRLAEHFSLALNDFLGGGEAMPRFWDLNEVFSDGVREKLVSGEWVAQLKQAKARYGIWDEWLMADTFSSVVD